MNATRRRRRTFQPDVDSLEGRVVLSAAAAAEAAHAHAVEVTEQRQLKHEGKAELHTEKLALRNDRKIIPASLTIPGALSVTDGTPIQTTSSGSGSGTTATRTALRIHTMAPNDLDAANLAFQGMSVGVASSGSVGSHGRTGRGTTKTTTTGTTTGAGTGTVTTTTGTGTTTTTTTLSPASGGIGTVTITLPTTATASTTSTSGGTM